MHAQERDELSSSSEQSTTLRLKRSELRKRQDELDRLMRLSGRELNALLPTQSHSKYLHAVRRLLRLAVRKMQTAINP